MTEIICDRCRDDVGKRAALVIRVDDTGTAARQATVRQIDLCVACKDAFEAWLRMAWLRKES